MRYVVVVYYLMCIFFVGVQSVVVEFDLRQFVCLSYGGGL